MAETYWREYLYYPGCSLHSSGRSYDESSRAVAAALGAKLVELEDWNCCGATAYMGIKELTAFTISARNLALAEQKANEIVAPCSGCYVGLNKTNNYLKEFEDVHKKVNAALSEGQLTYNGTVKVRHLLDVFTRDIGTEKVKQFVVKPLTGLKVGCYYGCQIVRPRNEIDDPECPETMEALMKACGATPVDFAMKAFCCGGALMGTEEEIGLRLIKNLLHSASRSGVKILVTPCPLCQMNLDAYQDRAARKYKMDVRIPILYFTQLIGLALGIEPKKLGIGREIISASEVLKPYL
jgi:heterodisulfide reductase subunit B